MNINELTPPTLAEMAMASGVAKRAAKDWSEYARTSKRRASVIAELLEQVFDDDLDGRRVLDWGCSLGGVAIHVEDRCPVQMHAADVDRYAIDWLAKRRPSITTSALTPGAEMPFDDSAFDAIYGISVFTHIPPEQQAFYLRELRRVVRPEGVVIVTVKSYAAAEYAREKGKKREMHPYTREQLNREGIIYASYPSRILETMEFAEKVDYGITYHSADYIEEIFGVDFLVDRSHGLFIGKQDVLLLRPRPA